MHGGKSEDWEEGKSDKTAPSNAASIYGSQPARDKGNERKRGSKKEKHLESNRRNRMQAFCNTSSDNNIPCSSAKLSSTPGGG